MSEETIETQISNLRESDAYKDTSHEGHDQAKKDMAGLFESRYGTAPGSEMSSLDKEMAEALHDLKHGPSHKHDPEARFDNKIVEGEPKFGDPMPVDESGVQRTIEERPDLYVWNDEDIITREDVVEMGDDDTFNDLMTKINPKWQPHDAEIFSALKDFATSENVEGVDEVFQAFIRSPEYGETFTLEEGEAALIRYCDGDADLAVAIRDRAISVIESMPEETKRVFLEDTSIGNNPRLIALISGLAETANWSPIDDQHHRIDPFVDDDDESGGVPSPSDFGM